MSTWKTASPDETAHLWVRSCDHPDFDEPLCDRVLPAFHSGLTVVAHEFDPSACCAECQRLSGGEVTG